MVVGVVGVEGVIVSVLEQDKSRKHPTAINARFSMFVVCFHVRCFKVGIPSTKNIFISTEEFGKQKHLRYD